MSSTELSGVFERGAGALDIPEELAEDAILQYESVAAWLGEEDSPLHEYSPEIYPQGSFRLGTPIRPLLRGEEFDIDLVCKLTIPKERVSQKDLKRQVGARLRQNEDLAKTLEERRRCWSISYKGRFHLDVLPAIPDSEAAGVTILVTDTELVRWQHSNPIGYADWFFERMGRIFEERLAALARAAGVPVEDVPRWRVRTPLQRAVQLLKRHRDLRFPLNNEDRPVSIIITTLAARAYCQQPDVYTALVELARTMPRYIENRGGKWWIPNPAHPEENFADKWNENPVRRNAFIEWLRTVELDLALVARATSDATREEIVSKQFGSGSSLSKVAASSVVPGLAAFNHLHPPKWPERPTARCRVRGWVYPRVRKGKRLWELTERPVPKQAGLRFEATTNASPPYEIHWQVVNTGREAAAARQLRGGFETSEAASPGVRWERILYTGTHWVEAFVVKDGVCVARLGRKHVHIRG